MKIVSGCLTPHFTSPRVLKSTLTAEDEVTTIFAFSDALISTVQPRNGNGQGCFCLVVHRFKSDCCCIFFTLPLLRHPSTNYFQKKILFNATLTHFCVTYAFLILLLLQLQDYPSSEHCHQHIPLGYFLSFFLSGGQLLVPLLLSWLNSGNFPICLLFCFPFHHYFFAQRRNILYRPLRIKYPNRLSCSYSDTQIWWG